MAGEKTISFTQNLVFSAGAVGGAITLTVDDQYFFQKTIPANSVNVEIDVGSVLVGATLVAIIVDVSANATVYTNAPSTGAPAETFVLTPNNPAYWYTGKVGANPFLTTITKLYVTTSTLPVTVKFAHAHDATPGL